MLKIYNTLTRQIEEFKPLNSQEVGLYACGPTVYHYAHVGNLRAYLFEDVLKRVLKFNNYNVKHVMNITDVGHLTDDADEGEDKMEKGSRREGKTAWEVAEFYTKEFKQDLVRLNIIEPNIWCKATDYIDEQIDLIKKLAEKGFVYKTTDGVYFDTSRYPDYARLGKLNLEEQQEGARVQKVEDKKNPTDFALWKFSPVGEQRQMEWHSPWGVGFPGWHIECSAMSMKHLGEEFDIHCGGIDHIPVHHTNERAQNWGATGKETVKYWMHGAFLNIASGDKMAKSGDNFITLQTLIDKKINPLAYRYLVLQTHYRSQLAFSWGSLQAAQNGLDNLYNIIREWDEEEKIGCAEYEERFLEAINDDLDTPKALAILHELIKDKELPIGAKKKTILKFDQVFGLSLSEIKKIAVPAEVLKLVEEREIARKNKDWARSDELRAEIAQLGFEVEDGKEGIKVRSL